jgi:hypothetical protein
MQAQLLMITYLIKGRLGSAASAVPRAVGNAKAWAEGWVPPPLS